MPRELNSGNLVGIFPEGKLTTNGNVDTFKPGINRILSETPIKVVPMALQGLWGSYFSNYKGKPMTGIPTRLWRKITLLASIPVEAKNVNAQSLQKIISNLLSSA